MGDPRPAELLDDTLSWSRDRDYVGWDYFDGLSSGLLQRFPLENSLLNIAVQEGIKRTPVNLRPLFFVEQRRSFKGTSLFALANIGAASVFNDDRYLEEARRLLDWLIANRSRDYSGFCGGHQHDVQTLERVVPAREPDIVSTSYAVRALLAGGELDERYRDFARSAAGFIREDLWTERSDGSRLKYHIDDESDAFVLNANAIGARTLLEIDHAGGGDYTRDVEAILDYVASQQQPIGGWMYTDPPAASHLSMDNHHNGFILETFLRYRDLTGSSRYDDEIDNALVFSRDYLFENTGAPRFDEHSTYPRDIHAAAQGIITFTLADQEAFADRIIEWTERMLAAGDGRFYFQRHRFFTNKTTLMRWCQAWMAFALATRLTTGIDLHEQELVTPVVR